MNQLENQVKEYYNEENATLGQFLQVSSIIEQYR